MAACLLQLSRPDNIIFLIETCLQLDKNRNLLTVLGSCSKRSDDRRVAADTVQCLFDRQYIRILRSFPDEIDYRIKALIWVMQKHIVIADLSEKVLLTVQPFWLLWCVFRYFKLIVALHAGKLHQEGKVEWPVDMEDIVFLNMELLFENL